VRRLWKSVAVVLVVIAVAALYQFVFGDRSISGEVRIPEAVATLDGGEGAVAVSADGTIVPWLPLPAEAELPELPPLESPKGGRLTGSMLEQVRVLGAAPVALRPYLARSHYGESGVDVETTTGIELRFGDDSQAARKWKAAAAVLADPSIEALDYVNLHAPARPTIGGSGHTLPPPP
jgi:hypothetical protein